MDFDKCLKGRRSIRKYKKKPVPWKKLAFVLDAARYSPSAGNLQNWRFILVDDKEKRDKISTACLGQKWMNQAPVFIIVCSDNSATDKFYKNSKYPTQNCAVAIQNIMLKAHSLGLGTCWIGAFDERAIKRDLKIPDNISLEGIITLGVADQKPAMPKRLDMNNLLSFNEWDNKNRDSMFPLKK